MSISTSIVNSANTAYKTLVHASTTSLVWLKDKATTTASGTKKLALLAKDFFTKAAIQGFNMSKTYAAAGLRLAKANPFVSGAAIGISIGIASAFLIHKYRTPATTPGV